MRARLVAATVAFGAALLVVPTAGASAAPAPGIPSQLCGEQDTVTILYTHPSDGWTKPVTRTTSTHGGCASAWATGQMTSAAITKQCSEVLSRFFPFSPYGYLIENQGDCIRVMGGLSRGSSTPDQVWTRSRSSARSLFKPRASAAVGMVTRRCGRLGGRCNAPGREACTSSRWSDATASTGRPR